MRYFFMSVLLTSVILSGFSQPSPFLRLDQRPKVLINSDTLDYPWTGGFNSVIPVQIDFNGDSILDVFLFDRVGNRISTFINDGSSGTQSYQYAPQFSSLLPPLQDWVLSADYDCDGDFDLYTYENSAMKVWRNDYSAGTGLQFSPANPQVSSWYGTFYNPVFVSQVNMPAIVDVDGDDDLDIITFANSSNYLEYHKNYAMDSLGTCNGFLFTLQPYCWGYFKLSGLTNIGILNQSCRSGNIQDSGGDKKNAGRHSGSVLTPLDQDCDGDVDLLNGDILGENLLFLLNGGTPDSATIVSQDSAFPVYDVQVNMQNLPAGYYLDLDNDGLKDMMVTPFATVGEDFNNIHFYKNTSDNCSNVFSFVKPRLFSDETIDAGTASNVAFFDVDKDGLMDILTGNDFYYNPNPNLAYSRFSYYKNIGTNTQPMFTLITDDWLGLSAITQYGLFSSFGDLDGDNDDDLLLGNADGILIYYQNTAGPGMPCNFVFASPMFQGIDIGNNSTPQIIDVNRDGKNDLLIGERSGVLNYYENTGTIINPVFTLISANFGGVNVLQPSSVAGYSNPVLFDNGNGYELLVGSDKGSIFYFNNIDGNLNGTFTLVDSAFQGIYEPKRVTLSRADIDGDLKYDLLTGCNAGGMRLYTQSSPSLLTVSETPPSFVIIPNPASDFCRIQVSDCDFFNEGVLTISDITGKELSRNKINSSVMQLNTTYLTSGLYLARLESVCGVSTQKLVIK